MADIFISYANEDRERAGQVAALLESEGWSVWWDRRIPAGRTWRKVLEDALVETRCMLVLWSKNSVSSPWVAEEAEEARRLEKTLIPVMIERVEPPIGFRAIQAADLTGWDGSIEHPAARLLTTDVRSLLGGSAARREEPPRVVLPRETAWQRSWRWIRLHWPKAALGCAALVVALLLVRWSEPELEDTPIPAEQAPAAPEARRLTGLAVSARQNRIKPAEKVKLTLKGQYSDGSEDEVNTGVEWVSSDTAIAVVDEHGEVTGIKAGTASIIAKIGAVASSEWSVGVEPAAAPVRPAPEPGLVALRISSAKQELEATERVALRARAIYSDKSEKALSSGVEWRVSDRSLATLTERGELIARRAGRVEVVARVEKISSPPQTFVIKERPKEPAPPPEPPKPYVPPVKPPILTEQNAARIRAYLNRAQTYREQGNYAAALAELNKARTLDSRDENIQREIEQTRRACTAERTLGNPVQCD